MEEELDRHSPLWRIFDVLITDHENRTDNQYIEGNEAFVSLEELKVIRNLLQHSSVAADQIYDDYGD